MSFDTIGQSGTSQIADGAITAAKLASNAVTNIKVDAAAAIAQSKLAVNVAYASGDLILLGEICLDINERESVTSTTYVDGSNSNTKGGWGAAFAAPSGCTLAYKFQVTGYNSNAGTTISAQLYNITTSAAVTGSEVTQVVAEAGGASVYTMKSAEITIDPTSDYKAQFKASANTGVFFETKLLVFAKVS